MSDTLQSAKERQRSREDENVSDVENAANINESSQVKPILVCRCGRVMRHSSGGTRGEHAAQRLIDTWLKHFRLADAFLHDLLRLSQLKARKLTRDPTGMLPTVVAECAAFAKTIRSFSRRGSTGRRWREGLLGDRIRYFNLLLMLRHSAQWYTVLCHLLALTRRVLYCRCSIFIVGRILHVTLSAFRGLIQHVASAAVVLPLVAFLS